MENKWDLWVLRCLDYVAVRATHLGAKWREYPLGWFSAYEAALARAKEARGG